MLEESSAISDEDDAVKLLDMDSRLFSEAIVGWVRELSLSEGLLRYHFAHDAHTHDDEGDVEIHRKVDCSSLVVAEATVYRKGLAWYLRGLPKQSARVLNQTHAFGWRPVSEFVQDMSRSSDALDNATLDMGGGSGAGFQIYCAANIGNGSGGDSDSGDDKLVAETMLATAGGGGGGGFQGRPREFLTFGGGGGGGLQFRSFRNTRNLTSRLTEWASLGGGGGCGTIGNADDDDARLECDTEDTFGASPPVACGQHFDDGSGSRDWDAAASFLLFEESLQQCARGRDSAVVVRGGGGGGGGAGTACKPFSIGYGFGFEARISNGSGHISDPDNVDGHHAPTISGDEESKDVVGAILQNASSACTAQTARNGTAPHNESGASSASCGWPCICAATQEQIYQRLLTKQISESSTGSVQCLAAFLYVQCGQCTANAAFASLPSGARGTKRVHRYGSLLAEFSGKQGSGDNRSNDQIGAKANSESHCWSRSDDSVPLQNNPDDHALSGVRLPLSVEFEGLALTMPGVQTGEISLQQEEVLHESRYAAAALILVLAAPVFICAILQRRKFHARWRAECGAGPYREIIEYNVAVGVSELAPKKKTTELTSLERAQDWPPIKSREKGPRRASAGMEGIIAYALPFARGHHTGEKSPLLALGVSEGIAQHSFY